MSYLQAFAKKAKGWFFFGYNILNRKRLYTVYVFCFFVVFFLLSYMTLDKTFALDDHFFHIRFAEIFREQGMSAFSNFESIYFSRMGVGQEYLVYYNFLFYLALIPFTFFTPLVIGLKMYGVVALSLSFTVVYVFLKKVYVKYPFLWVLLFLMMLMRSALLLRFSLARPFTLAPVFLVLMLYFMYQRKHWISGAIAFLYFYWHTATFFFPLSLAIGYFLFEQFYGKKPDWKMIAWPFTGTVAAIFLAYFFSPGIIAYLRDVIFPVFFDTALFKDTGVAEGGEVYGRNFFTVLSDFFSFLALFITLGTYEVLRYVRGKRKIQEAEEREDTSIQPLRATLFMATLVFWGGSFLSGRFLDYFAYFCLLYVAISVTDVAKFFSVRGVAMRSAVVTGAFIVGTFLLVNLTLSFHERLGASPSHLVAQGTADWLNNHVEPGEIVFNVDWSSFPALYYFTGDRFRYATGLEPRFLYDLDQRMYWIWRNMGDNAIFCEERDCDQLLTQREMLASVRQEDKKWWYEYHGNHIADAISEDFQTDIIVVSNQRKGLLEIMDNSDRFKQEFFDEKNSAYAIYRIVGETEKK